MNAKRVFWMLMSGLLAAGMVAGGCGGGDDDGDAGTTQKDGGPPPLTTDAGNTTATDGGSSTTTDGGTKTDGGAKPTLETSPVEINDLSSASHPAEGSKVHFKAVAVGPVFYISKSTSASDSRYWNCLWGMFVASPTAGSVPYNGVMLVSKGTVDANKQCQPDSQLHPASGAQAIAIGEELDVTGLYQEYCAYFDSTAKACKDKTSAGVDVTYPEIQCNMSGDIKRTGNTLAVPDPVAVTVDEITSSGTAGSYTLGSNWWKYRSVLVKLTNVDAVSLNPDGTKDFCEWTVAPQGTTTPALRVDDAMTFGGLSCPHRPKTVGTYSSLTGVVYWGFGNSKLLPRKVEDATPNLP